MTACNESDSFKIKHFFQVPAFLKLLQGSQDQQWSPSAEEKTLYSFVFLCQESASPNKIMKWLLTWGGEYN